MQLFFFFTNAVILVRITITITFTKINVCAKTNGYVCGQLIAVIILLLKTDVKETHKF